MIVIAVLHFDVHSALSHAPRDFAELSRLGLTQTLHEYFILADDADSGGIERLPGGIAIGEEKVRDAVEHTAPFDAHAGAAERFSHFRERAGAILERDGQILHARTSGS